MWCNKLKSIYTVLLISLIAVVPWVSGKMVLDAIDAPIEYNPEEQNNCDDSKSSADNEKWFKLIIEKLNEIQEENKLCKNTNTMINSMADTISALQTEQKHNFNALKAQIEQEHNDLKSQINEINIKQNDIQENFKKVNDFEQLNQKVIDSINQLMNKSTKQYEVINDDQDKKLINVNDSIKTLEQIFLNETTKLWNAITNTALNTECLNKFAEFCDNFYNSSNQPLVNDENSLILKMSDHNKIQFKLLTDEINRIVESQVQNSEINTKKLFDQIIDNQSVLKEDLQQMKSECITPIDKMDLNLDTILKVITQLGENGRTKSTEASEQTSDTRKLEYMPICKNTINLPAPFEHRMIPPNQEELSYNNRRPILQQMRSELESSTDKIELSLNSQIKMGTTTGELHTTRSTDSNEQILEFRPNWKSIFNIPQAIRHTIVSPSSETTSYNHHYHHHHQHHQQHQHQQYQHYTRFGASNLSTPYPGT